MPPAGNVPLVSPLSGPLTRRQKNKNETLLVERLHEFARTKRRRGYRLVHRELRRDGMHINHKRVHRLWKQEGLSVPARKTYKRIRG